MIGRIQVIPAFALCALAAASAPGPARAETAAERSCREARAALEVAIRAAGGADALRAIRIVSRVGRAAVFNQGQSLDPEAAYTQRALDVVATADLERQWSAVESATTAAGNPPSRALAVFKGDAGFVFNRVTSVLAPMSPAALAAARSDLARDPAVVLLTAAGRAETLRSLGSQSVDGRPHRVVSFADRDGNQIALYIDAGSGVVTKQEVLADNAVLGDVAVEVFYSDHRRVAGVLMPFRVVTRTAGRVTQDLRYSQIKVNGGAAGALFEPPAQAVRVSAIPPPTKVTVTRLGKDVYFAGGSSHNSLFVSFRDHVLLVEAPQSVERTQAVLAAIRETVGDKPVRYVVPTHYHFDHLGGLRAAIAAGATVVTTSGNRAQVERMAAAPHAIRPDALSRAPRRPAIQIVSGKRVFTDGAHTVEIHELGATAHVDQMLVAYLPAERVVFVSDLFGIPLEGPVPPAGANTRQFAQKLREKRWKVDRIAPGHGRLGTMKDLADALAKPLPALPPIGP
jgi:glyoxylase-like metal-dependent hydrolase (beta-lactamase superfamily II)